MSVCASEIPTVVRQPCPVYLFSQTDTPIDDSATAKTNTSDFGNNGDHPIPAHVRQALETIFGESVDDVDVKVKPFYVAMHGANTIATTRRDKIRLRNSIDDFVSNPRLTLHEYYHVLRQWNTGVLNRRRYLKELAKNGYYNSRYEKEAREFASKHLEQFKELLRGLEQDD